MEIKDAINELADYIVNDIYNQGIDLIVDYDIEMNYKHELNLARVSFNSIHLRLTILNSIKDYIEEKTPSN